jgi:hypothetical protein
MTLFIEIPAIIATHIGVAIVGAIFSKCVTEKKKIRQFYEGMKPVIGLITELRIQKVLSKDHAKQFVKTISKSFHKNFEIGKMLTKDFGEYDNNTKLEFGICGDKQNRIARNNLCQECDLNCSIWNFKV